MHHLSHAYPYWNRTGGADHIFFLTTDRSGCWKPFAVQASIIIGYLGFRASEGYFGFEERLMWPRQGPNRRNNAYSLTPGNEALALDCYRPGQDVVVPVDASIGASEVQKLPRPGEEGSFRCLTTYKKNGLEPSIAFHWPSADLPLTFHRPSTDLPLTFHRPSADLPLTFC